MIIRYSPGFIRKLKKINVRIRKNFRGRIKIFRKDPLNLQLRNHKLRNEYEGLRSINITADYRAIYKEVHEGKEINVYFVALGTHKELYT